MISIPSQGRIRHKNDEPQRDKTLYSTKKHILSRRKCRRMNEGTPRAATVHSMIKTFPSQGWRASERYNRAQHNAAFFVTRTMFLLKFITRFRYQKDGKDFESTKVNTAMACAGAWRPLVFFRAHHNSTPVPRERQSLPVNARYKSFYWETWQKKKRSWRRPKQTERMTLSWKRSALRMKRRNMSAMSLKQYK